MKVYLASHLGFAHSTLAFMEVLEGELGALRIQVLNPWRNPDSEAFIRARAIEDTPARAAELRRLNLLIGKANETSILAADLVVAVLDGTDVDSGTASEIGFAYAQGKPVVGLRTDFRLAGENEATPVNLQV